MNLEVAEFNFLQMTSKFNLFKDGYYMYPTESQIENCFRYIWNNGKAYTISERVVLLDWYPEIWMKVEAIV